MAVSFNEKILDEALEGTTAVYTPPRFNSLLGSVGFVQIYGQVSQVTEDQSTLSITAEASADDTNFGPIYEDPIAFATLSNSSINSIFGFELGQSLAPPFRRYKLTLGGTSPRARVKLYATGRCEFPPTIPDRAPAVSTDFHDPGAANTAAVVTYAAEDDNSKHCISGVAWSYSAAPTAGKITMTNDGTTVFEVDIVAAGPDSIAFPVPKMGSAGKEVKVTLAAGGAGVSGKLSVLGSFTDGVPRP